MSSHKFTVREQVKSILNQVIFISIENASVPHDSGESESVNITDEEKEKLKTSVTQSTDTNRPFFDTVLSALDCTENDYLALLALCLIYALANNKGNFRFTSLDLYVFQPLFKSFNKYFKLIFNCFIFGSFVRW